MILSLPVVGCPYIVFLTFNQLFFPRDIVVNRIDDVGKTDEMLVAIIVDTRTIVRNPIAVEPIPIHLLQESGQIIINRFLKAPKVCRALQSFTLDVKYYSSLEVYPGVPVGLTRQRVLQLGLCLNLKSLGSRSKHHLTFNCVQVRSTRQVSSYASHSPSTYNLQTSACPRPWSSWRNTWQDVLVTILIFTRVHILDDNTRIVHVLGVLNNLGEFAISPLKSAMRSRSFYCTHQLKLLLLINLFP